MHNDTCQTDSGLTAVTDAWDRLPEALRGGFVAIVKAVSQRLGHASIDITLKTYAHVLPEDDQVLADGLDRMFG